MGTTTTCREQKRPIAENEIEQKAMCTPVTKGFKQLLKTFRHWCHTLNVRLYGVNLSYIHTTKTTKSLQVKKGSSRLPS